MKNSEKILLGVAGLGGLALLLGKKQTASAPVQQAVRSTGIVTDSDRLMDIARRELNLPDSELTVRSLIPSDFGLTTFTFALNPGWNTIVNTTARHKAIMLRGLFYSSATPVATEVRVNMGSSAVEDWGIQSIPMMENHQFVDISPSIAHPDYPIMIQVYASAASAAEGISFEGTVVEPRGMTVA